MIIARDTCYDLDDTSRNIFFLLSARDTQNVHLKHQCNFKYKVGRLCAYKIYSLLVSSLVRILLNNCISREVYNFARQFSNYLLTPLLFCVQV